MRDAMEGLAKVGIVPVVVLCSIYFQKKLIFYHRQVREKNSQITGAFNEGITGAPTIKTLVLEDKELYYPEQVFSDQVNNIENYPTDIVYADMHDNTTEEKARLLDNWEY